MLGNSIHILFLLVLLILANSCKTSSSSEQASDESTAENSIKSDQEKKACYTLASTIDQISRRQDDAAVWTGNEMIVYGGWLPNGQQIPGLNTAASYAPHQDKWKALPSGPEARIKHQGVWTGSKVMFWGGKSSDFGGNYSAGVVIYDPSSETWSTVSAVGEPSVRTHHSVVWDGTEMIVWGGTYWPGNANYNDGARFNPSTNTWTAVSTVNAPSGRWGHIAVWDGTEMIIIGGENTSNWLLSDAYAYNPTTDVWRTLTFERPFFRSRSLVGIQGRTIYLWHGQDASTKIEAVGARIHLPTGKIDYLKEVPFCLPHQGYSHNSGVWTGHDWILRGVTAGQSEGGVGSMTILFSNPPF